jgi:hypothetical protein
LFRKNIPSDIKWEPNTVPPQYTDHADQVIEKGTSLRLKILGVKPDVAAINAIGTIKEDYLGWVCFALCVIASANTRYFLFLDHSKYTKLAAFTTITTIEPYPKGERWEVCSMRSYQTYRGASQP